jgi:sec-independent protein translocase protein TatB
MFDIGWTELIIVGIIALIVIGPRELPKTLRTVGQMMTKVRRMASEFQGQFNEAIREAELDELRKEAEKFTNITNPLGDFDPLSDVKSQIESAVEGKPKPKAETASESAPESAPEPAPAEAAPGQIESADTPKEAAPGESAESAPENKSEALAGTKESGGGRAA